AEPGGLDAGLRHRAGNVVEFEVEKDVAAVAVHHAHHLGARLEEELLADLEGPDLRCQQTHQALRFGEPVDVEGEDEPVSQAVGGAPDQWWPYLGPTSAATRAATSPTGTSAASAAVRGFTSTQPRARARGPTVTRTGSPIRSASLNFTPGRSSRSSSSVSTPEASSASARLSAVSRRDVSPTFTGTTCAP